MGSLQQQICTLEYRPRDIDKIPVMKVLSTDPLLFAQSQSNNKYTSLYVRPRSLTGSVLLGTGVNYSLINTPLDACRSYLLVPHAFSGSRWRTVAQFLYTTGRYPSQFPWVH